MPLIQVFPSAVDVAVMVPPRLWMGNVTLQVQHVCQPPLAEASSLSSGDVIITQGCSIV